MPGPRVRPMVIRAELATDREATWRALTDPAQVERWLTRASRVGAPGDRYELDFGDEVMRGEIIEVVPGERLAYTWGWGDTAGARTCVAWQLLPGGDGTLVVLTHDGWGEAGLAVKDRDEHAAHWEGYVAALVEVTDGDVAAEDA